MWRTVLDAFDRLNSAELKNDPDVRPDLLQKAIEQIGPDEYRVTIDVKDDNDARRAVRSRREDWRQRVRRGDESKEGDGALARRAPNSRHDTATVRLSFETKAHR